MKTLGMLAIIFCIGSTLPTVAAIPERAPYYMCFAYTPDGLFFAGGDFNLERAKRLLSTNCGLPKNLTVVLLKTILLRKNGKIAAYNAR